MSVCAFSVQHDAEVQAYNEMRKVFLALAEEQERKYQERKRQEKARKQEKKVLREAFNKDRRMMMQADNYNKNIISRIFRKKEKETDRQFSIEKKVVYDDSDVEVE